MKIAVENPAQIKGVKQGKNKKKKNSVDFISVLLKTTEKMIKNDKKINPKKLFRSCRNPADAFHEKCFGYGRGLSRSRTGFRAKRRADRKSLHRGALEDCQVVQALPRPDQGGRLRWKGEPWRTGLSRRHPLHRSIDWRKAGYLS